MEKLSQILWRERELLDTLLFKLEAEQLVLGSGRTRWLLRAAREVENMLTTLRETELLRAVAADEVAASIGLEHNPSLRLLAEAVEEPWRSILADHHEAFVTLTREIGALAESNRDLIAAGYRSARETSWSVGPTAREALAAEVDQIRGGLIDNANSSYLGRPVFGGVTPGPKAYDADGVTIRVDVDRTTTTLTDVGTRQTGVGSAIQAAHDSTLKLKSSLSMVENVGLPKIIVDLQMQQTAYQASLAATSKVVQPSLLDFLR